MGKITLLVRICLITFLFFASSNNLLAYENSDLEVYTFTSEGVCYMFFESKEIEPLDFSDSVIDNFKESPYKDIDFKSSMVFEKPSITLQSISPICKGASFAILPYSASTNSPNKYSILFSTTDQNLGFKNISEKTHPFKSGPGSLSIEIPPNAPFGTYTATFFVSNTAKGDNRTITFKIEDSDKPTISAPATTSGTTNVGCTSTNVNLGSPVVADNCTANTKLIITNNAPSAFPFGTTTVTWTVKDEANNTATATQFVTVTDNINPTISAPANKTTNTDTNKCTASGVSLGTPTTADNCGVQSVTNNAPATFPLGETTVIWTVTDNSNNTKTATQKVTVEDKQDPSITALVDKIISADNDKCTASGVNLGTPTTADNCGVKSVTNNAPATFPLGETTVIWTVTDNSNNSTTAIQKVTIEDKQAPTISAPDNKTVSADNDKCTASGVNLGTPTTADNCGVQSVTNNAPATFPLGETTVTWTITDNSNNTKTATQKVTVEDKQSPTIIAPDNKNVSADNNKCTASGVNLGTPTTEDNCGVQSVTNNAPETFPLGETIVTWTVTDNSNNTETTTQKITVEDKQDPSITAQDDKLFNTDLDLCTASEILLGTPITSDNCEIKSLTSDAPSNFPLGSTTVTWTVIDNSDNVNTDTQIVTVVDNQAPIIPNLPDLIAECSLTVIPPTTTDNCGEEITGITGLTNLTFDVVGEEIINWVFTDASGNPTEPVKQKITITDTGAPVKDVNNLPIQSIRGCQISSISDLIRPTATDECEGKITGTLAVDFTFPYSYFGQRTIYWEYIDSKGNKSTQPQEIELIPVTIDGGSITGTFQNNQYNDYVNVAACGSSVSVALKLSDQIGTIIQWEKLSPNDNSWQLITETTNRHNITFAQGNLESTRFRVLIQDGTCTEYSEIFTINAVPAAEPPTVINLDEKSDYCLGETITLFAESNHLVSEPASSDSNASFETGQVKGWYVDGERNGFSCGGSNQKDRNWSCTSKGKNGKEHEWGDIGYTSGQGKFAVTQGEITSTFETPIMDFSNSLGGSIEFDQAFYFATNDIARIEISTNGGDSYVTLYDLHAAGNPIKNWLANNTWESKLNSTSTFYNFEEDNTSIPIPVEYLKNDVKIRWYFKGTTNKSIWALDNIFVSKKNPITTQIEWTIGIGDPDEDPLFNDGTTEAEIELTANVPGFHEYGGTALIAGCRTYSEEGTGIIPIYVYHAYAGEDIVKTSAQCGQNTVQLNAYDNTKTANDNAAKNLDNSNYIVPFPVDCVGCNNPGTGATGTWSYKYNGGDNAPDCTPVIFSNITDPNATFTAGAGNYTLTWTVHGVNGEIVCSDEVNVVLTACTQVNFDGKDDYVDFDDNYDLNGAFSLEIWVKPESINGKQTIFSKRDANNSGTAKGYDLKIDNGVVSFNWDKSGTISSAPYKIDTNRWYHIAITHTSTGEYKLYIDGVIMKLTGGGSPGSNDYKSILGAMDSSTSSAPLNYFNGWMDEFRIWDVALAPAELQLMMNQKINPSPTASGKVQGEILPLDVGVLTWSNLLGYYQMETFACGNLISTTNQIEGKLHNITSPQETTAPLPYISVNDGNWHNKSTWDPNNLNHWTYPNEIGIDNKTYINWNIAIKKNNINSDNKDIKLLGLLSKNGSQLLMNGENNSSGNELRITHYLDLNGYIDLNGESQLVQTEGSILVGSGSLERDQQGTASSFNYNYWGSAVLPDSISTTYKVNQILYDGTTIGTKIFKDIDFGTPYAYADDPITSPIKISDYWINTFRAKKADEYSQWEQIGSNTPLKPGEGFTMKGSSGKDNSGKFVPITDKQNYTFKGFPNNGTITVDKIEPKQNYLLGNPYPSAISVEEFILDNIKDGEERNENNLINGAIYLWDHFGGSTHLLREYVGGYAVRNILDGVPAISTDDRINSNGERSNKIPGPYIPVGQGFFVNTTIDSVMGVRQDFQSGNIVFKNSQRIFETEAVSSSQFLKPEQPRTKGSQENSKIRLDFSSPLGYHRQILVGTSEYTTNGFDLGYDAPLNDYSEEDFFWLINNYEYVIQGVSNFDPDQILPVGIYISKAGAAKIKINKLENIPDNTKIYLKDLETKLYHDLRKSEFKIELEPGAYYERFQIVFEKQEDANEETEEDENEELGPDEEEEGSIDPEDVVDPETSLDIAYMSTNRELAIINPNNLEIKKVVIYNLLGQKIQEYEGIETKKMITLGVKEFPMAVYLVKMYSEKGEISKNIMLMR